MKKKYLRILIDFSMLLTVLIVIDQFLKYFFWSDLKPNLISYIITAAIVTAFNVYFIYPARDKANKKKEQDS